VSAPAPIVVEKLGVAFGGVDVLKDLSFRVEKGQIFVLMGPSGCGKTTVLRCLVGLQRPTSGRVVVLGEDLAQLDEDELDRFRPRIGMLFQFGALLNSISVGDNVALPLDERTDLDEDTIRAIVKMKLAMVGLEGTHRRMPAELSGGMKKRAGLARAMALDPELYFLDEPTSGLDPNTAAEFDALVLTLRRAVGMTAVVVTHDLGSAFRIADRIGVLIKGRLVLQGTPDEVRASTDPRIRRFINREQAADGQDKAAWAHFFEEAP
jgi:phospholipid/cholesterol/gamma-HCH transport system ATP-binding protein